MVTRSLHAEPSWLPLSVSTYAKFFLWQVHTMSLFYDQIAEKLDTYQYAKQTFLIYNLWRSVVGSRIVPAFVSSQPWEGCHCVKQPWEGCDSQTDKCLGRPITKQWGSAARHSKTRPTFASEANLRGKLTQVLTTWDPLSIAINNNGNADRF